MADKNRTIKPSHKMFAQEYLANGNNATQAYLSVYPKANGTTAATNGYKLLAMPLVKAYLQQERERQMKRTGKTRDYVLEKLFKMIDDATTDNDRQNAIKALEIVNKMTGNYVNKSEITLDAKGVIFNFISPDKTSDAGKKDNE